MPAVAVSHIMLEAFKKYLLVALIAQGHKPKEGLNLPKYTSPVVTKYYKQLTQPYHELITAYYSNRREDLNVSQFCRRFIISGELILKLKIAGGDHKVRGHVCRRRQLWPR